MSNVYNPGKGIGDVDVYTENFFNAYYNWIELKVDPDLDYRTMLDTLSDIPFTWTIPNDENRAGDGSSLRLRFAVESNLRCLESSLDEPASVLEVLYALALRIENEVMYEPELGDRTNDWFWMMLKNLGLDRFSNKTIFRDDRGDYGRFFNVCEQIDDIVYRWMDRTYNRDGTGGIFPMPGSKKDQRKIEIWRQVMEILPVSTSKNRQKTGSWL